MLFVRFVRVVVKSAGPAKIVLPSFHLAISLAFCLLDTGLSLWPPSSYRCPYYTENHERSGRGTHPDVVGAERDIQRELTKRRPKRTILSQNQLVVWVVLYRDATEETGEYWRLDRRTSDSGLQAADV